jgi:hypothetical protein
LRLGIPSPEMRSDPVASWKRACERPVRADNAGMCNRYNISHEIHEVTNFYQIALPISFDLPSDDILPGHLAPGVLLNGDGERDLCRCNSGWPRSEPATPSTGSSRTTTPAWRSKISGRGSCRSKSIDAFFRSQNSASRATGVRPRAAKSTFGRSMAAFSASQASTTCGGARGPRSSTASPS